MEFLQLVGMSVTSICITSVFLIGLIWLFFGREQIKQFSSGMVENARIIFCRGGWRLLFKRY